MSYSMKEVQRLVGILIDSSCADEIFADMSLEYIDGEAHYNDTGDKYHQTLQAFVNDTTIQDSVCEELPF